MISLTIVILGIIILFAFLNYNNTINTATSMIDRFIEDEPKRNPNDRVENYKIKENFKIDGIYNIMVEDSKIIRKDNSSYDKKVEEYAIKISEKHSEKGIVRKLYL